MVLNDGDGSKHMILPNDLGDKRDEHAYIPATFMCFFHSSLLVFDLRGGNPSVDHPYGTPPSPEPK
jgi:hypothetical protein